MTDKHFYGRDSVSVIAFLLDFKASYHACNIDESVALWIFKDFLIEPVESVMKVREALPTKTARAQHGCLTTYSAIVNFLLKSYASNDNRAIVDSDMQTVLFTVTFHNDTQSSTTPYWMTNPEGENVHPPMRKIREKENQPL